MRLFLYLTKVITLLLDELHHTCVFFIGNLGRPRHKPYVITLVATDNGNRVVLAHMHDSVVRLERPYKLHLPYRIRLRIFDEACRVVLSYLAIKATFVETKGRGYRAIRVLAVCFYRVVRFFLDKRGDARNHVPLPHKPLQINVISCFHRRMTAASRDQNQCRQQENCLRFHHIPLSIDL